jgi:hypothetical protein
VRHPLDELAALGIEARGDVLRETADLEVAGVHPLAGDELEQVEDRLALAKQYQNIEIAPSSSADVPR